MPNVTVWEKCAVKPRHEPRTPRLQGECCTDWAIQLPDTLSPQWWISLNCDIHPHKFEIHPQISEINFHCKAFLTNQASMHGPMLDAKCHRVRKMCSQTGAWTRYPSQGKCSIDLTIRLPDILSPQWWQSLNCHIHIVIFQVYTKKTSRESKYYWNISSQIYSSLLARILVMMKWTKMMVSSLPYITFSDRIDLPLIKNRNMYHNSYLVTAFFVVVFFHPLWNKPP